MADLRTQTIEYISKLFAQEDDLLKNILQTQQNSGGPMMNIGPDQGKFIYLLTLLTQAKQVLEVGSYFGYSTLWLARALKQIPNSKLIAVDKSNEQLEQVKHNLSQDDLQGLLQTIPGDGLAVMQQLIAEQQSFDLIFIDANKQAYPQYLDLAYELLNPQGVLLVDNCLWNNRVISNEHQDKQTQAIREFNQTLAKHQGFESTLLTIQDGLAFGIKTTA